MTDVSYGNLKPKKVLNEKEIANSERSIYEPSKKDYDIFARCNVYRPQRMIIPGNSKQKPSPRLAQRNWKNAKWRENLGDRFYAGKRQKCKPASFCTRNGTNAQWQHIFRNVEFVNSGTRFNTLFRDQMRSAISNNESSERLECPHMS